MAKFNIKRVTFKAALPCVGGSAWMSHIKQAGIQSAEYDSSERMLTLLAPAEKIRIPVESVAEMVFGVTQAGPGAKLSDKSDA